ncbi:MAG: hypothetical protein ACUVWN_12355 [bacterium]
MIYQNLFDQVRKPELVHAGVIGCGSFSSAIVTQSSLVPRLRIPVVADTNIELGDQLF